MCFNINNVLYYRMQNIPSEIVKYIADIHEGLRHRSASVIQVWWRYYGSKVPCDDCCRFKYPPLLRRVPGCADYQIMFNLCCDKMVCKYGCHVYCTRGHLNVVHDDDGYRYPFDCTVCDEIVKPKFEWHGDISPSKMRERVYQEGVALSHYVSII